MPHSAQSPGPFRSAVRFGLTPASTLLLALTLCVCLPPTVHADADGAWSLLPTIPAPEARIGAAGAYSPLLNSLVVAMGNSHGVLVDDAWQLTLGPTPEWSPVATSNRPLAREGAAMVNNHPFSELLVFGGENGTSPLSDLAALMVPGRPRWIEPFGLVGPQPPPRTGMGFVTLGSSRLQMLFGGRSGSTYFDDTWWFDRSSWQHPAYAIEWPSARAGHSLTYDPSRGRVILFGGDRIVTDGAGTHREVYADVWAFNVGVNTWTRLSDSGPQRTEHSAVYDAVRDRIVVFGGSDDSDALSSQAWAYSLSQNTWSLLTPTGSTPEPRSRHVAIYDPIDDRMVVFGGSVPGGASAETWLLGFGATAQPEVSCAWTDAAEPGGIAHFRGVVTNRMGTRQVFAPAMKLERVAAFGGSLPLDAGATGLVTWDVELPDSVEGTLSTVFVVNSPGVPMPVDTCHCVLQVPALVTGRTATVEPRGVRLRWTVDPGITIAYVSRLYAPGRWFLLGTAHRNGDALEFLDAAVAPGTHYTYRLEIASAGHLVERGQIEVDVAPASATMDFAVPNPATGSIELAVLVAGPDPITATLYDVSGRWVSERRFTPNGARSQSVRFDTNGIDAGLYFVRVQQGAQSVTRRVCLLR